MINDQWRGNLNKSLDYKLVYLGEFPNKLSEVDLLVCTRGEYISFFLNNYTDLPFHHSWPINVCFTSMSILDVLDAFRPHFTFFFEFYKPKYDLFYACSLLVSQQIFCWFSDMLTLDHKLVSKIIQPFFLDYSGFRNPLCYTAFFFLCAVMSKHI